MNILKTREAVRTSRFVDPDEAAAAYHGVDMDLILLARAESDWRILEADAGDSLLVSAQMAAAVTARCAISPDTMTFAIGVADRDGWVVNGRAVDSGSLVHFSERAETMARTAGPINWISLHVSRATFARAFESFTRLPFPVAGGVTIFAPERADNARLRNTFVTAARLADTAPNHLRNEATGASFEKFLLEPLIRSIGFPAVVERLNCRTAAARILDYLEAHKSRAIFQSDLCAELGIGERSLRRVFVDYFGVSPARFLRLRRLNQARRALSQRYAPPANVTEVGMRYGFFDLGRFAAQYSTLFGELPSVTLRNTRSRIA